MGLTSLRGVLTDPTAEEETAERGPCGTRELEEASEGTLWIPSDDETYGRGCMYASTVRELWINGKVARSSVCSVDETPFALYGPCADESCREDPRMVGSL